MTPQYVTVTEAAGRLGVHRRTAQRWVREGRLAGHKTPGGHWRVDVQSMADATIGPREFAVLTGVGYRTVLRWCGAGRIAVAHRARRGEYRIPLTEVARVGEVER